MQFFLIVGCFLCPLFLFSNVFCTKQVCSPLLGLPGSLTSSLCLCLSSWTCLCLFRHPPYSLICLICIHSLACALHAPPLTRQQADPSVLGRSRGQELGELRGAGRCLVFSKSLRRKLRLWRFRQVLLASQQVRELNIAQRGGRKTLIEGADASAPPSNSGVVGAGVEGEYGRIDRYANLKLTIFICLIC